MNWLRYVLLAVCILSALAGYRKGLVRTVLSMVSLILVTGLAIWMNPYVTDVLNERTTLPQWVEENKLKICHFFMVEDLNHLQKGGRISKTAAVIGTMVQIKPIICLDNEGKLQIIRKERGRKKGMNKIVDMAIEACEGKMPDMVMIPHGNCPEDAAYVAELVRKKMGVTNVMMNNLGPVIGGHTGAGMIAIVCMADHR